jgi:DNA-binding FadR family transcriptional regulator
MVAEYLPPVEDESSERGPLAVKVARRIHQDVISAGWTVGEVLGSEEQLQKRYAVGRSVLREAVRLLEFEGVARRRPGPGGGLVVTAPDPDSVVRSAQVFLDHRGVRGEHLFAAWSALELVAVEAVVRNLDEQGIARLRGAVAQEREQELPGGPDGRSGLHAEIARMSENPALELFLQVVLTLTLKHGHPVLGDTDREWLLRRHERIVEAMVGGDAGLAQHRLRRYFERLASAGAIRDQDRDGDRDEESAGPSALVAGN